MGRVSGGGNRNLPIEVKIQLNNWEFTSGSLSEAGMFYNKGLPFL